MLKVGKRTQQQQLQNIKNHLENIDHLLQSKNLHTIGSEFIFHRVLQFLYQDHLAQYEKKNNHNVEKLIYNFF